MRWQKSNDTGAQEFERAFIQVLLARQATVAELAKTFPQGQ